MLIETHMLGELYATRYRGKDPKYALVISHGFAAHGGIYDAFCTYHAGQGVDIWSYDAPGHGKSTRSTRPRGQFEFSEWVQAGVDFATHVKQETGLPVFLLGSSFGAAAAYSGTYAEAVTGSIIMGSAFVPGGPFTAKVREPLKSEAFQTVVKFVGRGMRIDVDLTFDLDEDYGLDGASEMKHADPWNTWSYDMASWASVITYDPVVPIAENKKPILFVGGEKDPNFPPDLIKATAEAIAGPVEYKIMENATHQMMIYHTEGFCEIVQEFVNKYI
ncbi:MAG: alpha/beta hydrolase [Cyanothece sp. SIO1E1]|nr:alpha/beta hydrolase [Cyanothece sp. SIO1E1]